MPSPTSADDQVEPALPGSARWWLDRSSPPPRRRRGTLTLEAVVAAAGEVLQERGAQALTMRAVAEALGTGQASLYRHVASREELVTLLVDRALAVAGSPPPAHLDWRAAAEWSAHLFRRHLLERPALVPLLRGTGRLGPESIAGLEHAVSTLVGAGLPPATAGAAAGALATFIIGSVQLTAGIDAGDPGERRARRDLFAAQDPAVRPTVVRHADALAGVGADQEFTVGLTALLDGIAALAGGGGDGRRGHHGGGAVPVSG